MGIKKRKKKYKKHFKGKNMNILCNNVLNNKNIDKYELEEYMLQQHK